MRKMAFLIFFSIVLLVFSLVNYYIFKRGLQALAAGSGIRTVYIVVFWTLAAAFFAGRFLERIWLGTVSDILVWTGSFWMGAMLYFFLIVVLFALLRMVNHFLPFYPEFVRANYVQVKQYLLMGSLAVVALILLGGYINARSPRIKTVDITIPKASPGMQSLNAAVMSDIHLGTIVGNGRLTRIVQKVNGLNPDIILLPGDILDEDLAPVIRQNTGEILRQLKAPLGVYGVMGNHEYIGGPEEAFKYLREHGIQMLRDEVMKVNDSFYLIGRDDLHRNQIAGKDRQALEVLIQHTERNYPLIVMDHQPYHPEVAARAGADLMLSGHTHRGQLWPLNYIVNAVFEIGYGLGEIEGMKIYVSNGVGTWGPPVRVGNRPEIVYMKIRFGTE